jgi:hypothetical protein
VKRRTLDIIFSAGGLALAALLVVLGFVVKDQANFAEDYVYDQLGQQKIVFSTTEELTPEEKAQPGGQCLQEYAGKTMHTGKQAECYANYYIGFHMKESAKKAGYEGETYATMGKIRTQLTNDLNEAKKGTDQAAIDAAQKKLDAATSLRSTFQTGETLRGLLLTSYGFSIFGDKADLVANVVYILGGLLLLLSIAGFVHAFVTPKEKVVGIVATAVPAEPGKTQPV